MVSHGTCRCGWREPDTATLDNGPQLATAACYCPAEISSAQSALHLYEGQGGLVPGGKSTKINGTQALVLQNQTDATLTATFPSVDQWITVSPAPASKTASGNLQQVSLEKQILATVKVVAANSFAP